MSENEEEWFCEICSQKEDMYKKVCSDIHDQKQQETESISWTQTTSTEACQSMLINMLMLDNKDDSYLLETLSPRQPVTHDLKPLLICTEQTSLQPISPHQAPSKVFPYQSKSLSFSHNNSFICSCSISFNPKRTTTFTDSTTLLEDWS